MKKLDLKKYDVGWEYLNLDQYEFVRRMLFIYFIFCVTYIIQSILDIFNRSSYSTVIAFVLVSLHSIFTYLIEYIRGYKRQQIVKSNKCVDCEYYLPDAIIDACTYIGIIKEDGSVDYTLPCELNKSIDKQPSR